MKKYWKNLNFFRKVFIGSVTLILTLVILADFADDCIPFLVHDRTGGAAVLSRQLEEYAAAPAASRAGLRAELRRQGVWVIDLAPEALPGWTTEAGTLSVLDILPESDDWTTEWIIVEKVLPDGRLIALGTPEPWYYDAMEWLIWFLLIAVFAGVACYWSAIFLTARLRRIAAAAGQLAAGNLHERVPVEQEGGDEISDLSRSFNNMAESIGNALENERRLLYDISHELRSPLARMQLALDLLPDAPAAKQKEYVSLLTDDTQRMSDMVNGIIEQAKTSAVTDEFVLERLDARRWLSEVVDLVNFESKHNGMSVACRFSGLAGNPVFLRGNRNLLEQALFNILHNAARYSPDGSTVEVSAMLIEPPDPDAGTRRLAVEVRDFGPGVPNDAAGKLFKPFFRVENARDRASGGIGLGLALAKSYIRRHNGDVGAENAKPGLRVRITLPV